MIRWLQLVDRQVSVARVAPNVPLVKCFNLWSGNSLSSCSARRPCFHWLTVCLCFLSCSVPSISVQLNGSTSVSSALAGKRVTNHPSWALGLLGTGLWAGCRFHSLWCWRASFSSALVLWVSVCSGTESHKKNTTQTWNLFMVETTGESSFNEKRGDICLLQQQTWQQARLSPESSCWTEN